MVSDLLSVRIRQLPPEEQRYVGAIALQQLRASRKREKLSFLKTAPPKVALPVLTGATFEERRRQFEQYLRQETTATPLAFLEASTTNSNSDLFAVRLMTSPAVGEPFQICFGGAPDSDGEQKWRRWYWDGTQKAYLLYHTLGDDTGPYLPEFLFKRLAPALIATGVEPSLPLMKRWVRDATGQVLLPKPDQIRNLLQVISNRTPSASRIPFGKGTRPRTPPLPWAAFAGIKMGALR